MRNRKLTPTGDMTFGRGLQDFWIDVPDAVAQAVFTKLAMWQGEWILDPADGTPWNTRIMGRYTEPTRDPAIRARILSTPGMQQQNGIANYSSSLDRSTRKLKVSARLHTIFGQIPFEGPT
jgi:hypothetical protein